MNKKNCDHALPVMGKYPAGDRRVGVVDDDDGLRSYSYTPAWGQEP